MKILIVTLMASAMAGSAMAQKSYVDPNQRQKKGLVENEAPAEVKAEAPATPAVAPVAAPTVAPQQVLCDCQALQNMNEQLKNLYYEKEINQRAINLKEVTTRDENVKDTIGHFFSKNDTTDIDNCPNTKVVETNVGKLKKMIADQEAICDVYALRGIKK